MSRPLNSNIVTYLACVCSALGIQICLSEDHHDHDHAAPAPPAERRTKVSAEALAELLTNGKTGKTPAAPPAKLPPLPEGVEGLEFRDFYQMPVGPRGLEPSARLLSLDGKRVRIMGYMGKMRRGNKRQLIFAAMPLEPQPEEYGLCDDVPATHVLVTVPGNPDEELPQVSGPLLMTGTLSVGTFAEHGETSFVRMSLDAPPSPAGKQK